MGRLKKAAKSGDNLQMLIMLRDLLAERLENTKSDRDFAALSRQIVSVTAEIEQLQKESVGKTTSLSAMRARLKVVSE